jgi:hypothetical protein
MTNKISREELDAKLIASGVNPQHLRERDAKDALLLSIATQDTTPILEFTDSELWHAEDALQRENKIYRDEAFSDWQIR